MQAAARGDADGRTALGAPCSTDAATLERVRDGLRAKMAGVDPLSRHDRLEYPAATLERRTRTYLPALRLRGAL